MDKEMKIVLSLIGLLAIIFVVLVFKTDSVKEERQVSYPNPDGWVTDLAVFLDEIQETHIESQIQSYKDTSGHEIAVLTVPSLNGETIEQYGIAIADRWEVGTAGNDDGVILIISRDDRKVRIEVGGGLEGGLTDATAGKILDDIFTPYFREGKYYEGIFYTVVAINETILAE